MIMIDWSVFFSCLLAVAAYSLSKTLLAAFIVLCIDDRRS